MMIHNKFQFEITRNVSPLNDAVLTRHLGWQLDEDCFNAFRIGLVGGLSRPIG